MTGRRVTLNEWLDADSSRSQQLRLPCGAAISAGLPVSNSESGLRESIRIPRNVSGEIIEGFTTREYGRFGHTCHRAIRVVEDLMDGELSILLNDAIIPGHVGERLTTFRPQSGV